MSRTREQTLPIPDTTPHYIHPWMPSRQEQYSIFGPVGYETTSYTLAKKPSLLSPEYGALLQIGAHIQIINPDIITPRHDTQMTLVSDDMSSLMEFSIHAVTVIHTISTYQHIFPGSIVLEQGAGAGLMGLIALNYGADHVILYEKDKQLLEDAKKLYTQNGIDASCMTLIHDDLTHSANYQHILSQATIGIASIGRWGMYRDRKGNDADVLAMRALDYCPNLSVYICGGYDNPTQNQTGIPWSDRNDATMSDVSMRLQELGFAQGSFFDGESPAPFADYSTCAMLSR